MRGARVIGVLLALLVTACGEAEPTAQPIANTQGPPRYLQPPPPEVVNPSLRLRDRSEADRAAERAELGLDESGHRRTGGGGGGGSWEPPAPSRDPRPRELDRFRQKLTNELRDRVDAADDPCAQFRDTFAAAHAAAETPGEDAPDMPGRAQLARACRGMPSDFGPCLDQTYFREHPTECQEALERMGRRGERRVERARGRLEDIRRGRPPAPSDRGEDED